MNQLDAELAAAEARFGDVTPGTEKHIVWGPLGHVRAPWAVIYLHGFTATRQEIAPLPERVAQGLGGHCFYTRLAGHGRPGAAMAGMTVAQWQADALEALAIGQRLGERVLVIAASTGATLAAWAAQQAAGQGVAAWVLLSPNFGPKDPWAALMNWAWGRWLVRVATGGMRRSTPSSPQTAPFWTHEYPSVALFPMMALVRQVRASALEDIRAPVQVFYSPRDRTINVHQVRAAFARLGSPHKQLIEVNDSDSVGQHVLAGDLLAPNSTAPLVAQVLAFVARFVA